MRLGYGLGPKERIEAMRPHKTWSNANAGVLEAVLASLEDPAHVESERRRMNDTRRFLCSQLEKEGRRYIPSHANFVMIDLGQDVQDAIEALRARQVFPGRRFAAMPNWLRDGLPRASIVATPAGCSTRPSLTTSARQPGGSSRVVGGYAAWVSRPIGKPSSPRRSCDAPPGSASIA